MGIAVRDAEPEDAAAIARVHIRSWQGAYTHAFPAEALDGLSDEEYTRTLGWERWLRTERVRNAILVAVRDGEVVGFVHGCPARDDDVDRLRVGELAAIYVAPESWGLGAGQRLMEVLLERLRGFGFSEAVLWVLDDNPRARRFYEAAGWRVDGAEKEDVLLGTLVREVRYRIELAPGP